MLQVEILRTLQIISGTQNPSKESEISLYQIMQILLKTFDNLNFRISQSAPAEIPIHYGFARKYFINENARKYYTLQDVCLLLGAHYHFLPRLTQKNGKKFASCFFFDWIANLCTERFYLCAPCDVYRGCHR